MNDTTTTTDFDDYCSTAANAPTNARVPVEVRLTVDDPFRAYRRASQSNSVFFETSGEQSGWGYFATDPIRMVEAAPDGETGSLDVLIDLLDNEILVRGDCDVPYPAGAFGWLSYDIAREIEDLPNDTIDDRLLPRLQLGVFDRVVQWRNDAETTLRITACPRLDVGDDVAETYEIAREKALELARDCQTGTFETLDSSNVNQSVALETECSLAEYADRVRTVQQYIRDGDTFQTAVSHRLTAPAAVPPVAVFDALREVNPAPYSALIEFPDIDIVSSSPELLLDVADERLRAEPIAGTRPRGETDTEDWRFERELLDSEKEHAEHAMLVDLARNDLGQVSTFGSVRVRDYRRIDRYSEVMHTVSTVQGELRDDATVVDAVESVFPGGPVTGAPKTRTMEIIEEVEDTRRGPYAGCIGVFGFDGRATLNIAIRTLTRHEARYYLRVGAGIVHDSDPEEEYKETIDKARALGRVLNRGTDTEFVLLESEEIQS